MNRIRILSLLIALVLALSLPAMAEQDLEARIAELEAALAERDERIRELEWANEQLTASAGAFNGTDAFGDGEAAAEYQPDGVVTVAEARAEYEYRAGYYQAFGLAPDEYDDTLKQEVLEGLVEDAILRDKAREYGLYDLTGADQEALRQRAEEAFEETVRYYMAYREAEGKTDDQVRQETVEYLAGTGYTLESVTATLTNQAWRDRLYDYVTKDVTLTEASLEDYYRSETAAAQLAYTADPLEYEYARMDGSPVLWNPEGYRRVKALLIGFSDAAQIACAQLRVNLDAASDEAERARLQGQLDQLYESLLPTVEEVQGRIRAGDDFMALIDAYSCDEASTTEPTRSAGYYVSADSQTLTDTFREAAMALNAPGDVSEPVRAEQGYYILKYEADVTPGPVPYEEVREQLAENALEAQRDQAFNETVEAWLAEANIVYHPERF